MLTININKGHACRITNIPFLYVDHRQGEHRRHLCQVFSQPRGQVPVALEEIFAALCWVQGNASSLDVDANKLAVACDSAGGNLAAALAHMSSPT